MLEFMTDQMVQRAITSIAELVASLGVIAGVWLLKRYTGIQINQAMIDRIKSAAATEAGALVAEAENNLRNKVMTTGSPGVGSAASAIASRNPDAVKALGLPHSTLKQFVIGEIGKLQASAPTVGGNS